MPTNYPRPGGTPPPRRFNPLMANPGYWAGYGLNRGTHAIMERVRRREMFNNARSPGLPQNSSPPDPSFNEPDLPGAEIEPTPIPHRGRGWDDGYGIDPSGTSGDDSDPPFDLDEYIATHPPTSFPAPTPDYQGGSYRGDIRDFGGNLDLGRYLSLFNGLPGGYGTRPSGLPGGRVDVGGATDYTAGGEIPGGQEPGTNWGTMTPTEIQEYQRTHDPSGNPREGGTTTTPPGGSGPGLQQFPVPGHLGPGQRWDYGSGSIQNQHPGDGSEFDVIAASNASTSLNFTGNTGDEGHNNYQLVIGQPTWQLDPHTGALMHNGPIYTGEHPGNITPLLGGGMSPEQLALARNILQQNMMGGGGGG